MVVKVGDTIPNATVILSSNATEKNACAIPKKVSTADLFKGKVVLFAVPGCFTPTCHVSHLPSFVTHYEEFKKKGVDSVYCLSTNDIFVMDAWGKSSGADDKVKMVADGNGEFVNALGLNLDLTPQMMGATRAKRFALIAQDGVIQHLAVGDVDVSGAEAILAKL
ncbi:hypothetical protein HK103_005524 [Boothiomyces macroporosus]|uniref:Thioredoxin-dependent peroxiredoxin n=1 Tax=Boothiomyces macroporosus TaxID=261099 RepID=A0AAD5Y7D8_9FUNG|nr:hypothetical protein HK103_005524 [Boothiomyces macroporosus]